MQPPTKKTKYFTEKEKKKFSEILVRLKIKNP